MFASEILQSPSVHAFVLRVLVIVGLLVFLVLNPTHDTAWLLAGGVVADLFHQSKNGNGNGATLKR